MLSSDSVALCDRESARTGLCVWYEFYIVIRNLVWCGVVLSPVKTYRIQEEPLYVEVPDIYPCDKGSACKYLVKSWRSSCFTYSGLIYTYTVRKQGWFWRAQRKSDKVVMFCTTLSVLCKGTVSQTDRQTVHLSVCPSVSHGQSVSHG